MSLSKDLKHLRSSTKLTLDEFSEFSRRLRGKSVPEALGTIAQSQLGRALLEAAGLVVIVLVLGTVPFYFVGSKGVGSSGPNAATEAATAKSPAADAAADPEAKETTSSKLPATVEEAEKKLGIDTTAPATDPKVNPLERKTDDLLKELK